MHCGETTDEWACHAFEMTVVHRGGWRSVTGSIQLVLVLLTVFAAVIAATATLSSTLSLWMPLIVDDLHLSESTANLVAAAELAVLPALAFIVLRGSRYNPWLVMVISAGLLLAGQAGSLAVTSAGTLFAVRLVEVAGAGALLGGSIHLAHQATTELVLPASRWRPPPTSCWVAAYAGTLFAVRVIAPPEDWGAGLRQLWWVAGLTVVLGGAGLVRTRRQRMPRPTEHLPGLGPVLLAVLAPPAVVVLVSWLTEVSPAAALWPLLATALLIGVLLPPLRSIGHRRGLTMAIGGLLAGWVFGAVLSLVQPIALWSLLDSWQLGMIAVAAMAGAMTGCLLRWPAPSTIAVGGVSIAGAAMICAGAFISEVSAAWPLTYAAIIMAASGTAAHVALFRMSGGSVAAGTVILGSRLGSVLGGFLGGAVLLGELRSGSQFDRSATLAVLETLIITGLIVLAGAVVLMIVNAVQSRGTLPRYRYGIETEVDYDADDGPSGPTSAPAPREHQR